MRGWLTYLARTRSLMQQLEAYRRLKKQLANYCRILVLEFDAGAAAKFEELRQSRLRLGTTDLKIAAIVLAHDALLLSRNRKDFGKILGLKVEDWTA